MIYPTARAVLLAATAAPISLGAAAFSPSAWTLSLVWLIALGLLILLDAALGAGPGQARIEARLPPRIGVGASGRMRLTLSFEGAAAPERAEVALATDRRLRADPTRMGAGFEGGAAKLDIRLHPQRRGEARVEAVWMRWPGRFGLVWKQAVARPEAVIACTPDVQGVKRQVLRLFSRDSALGLRSQIRPGEGSEFHALLEAAGAVDPRAIDWKQSARHFKLLAKEFRLESSQPLVLAIDTGRVMGEPMDGAPRLDHAINAALLLAYAGLKLGDPVGVFGFGARPGPYSGLVSGPAAFDRLQSRLATLDYDPEETNFTLGLSRLSETLRRPAVVVVFTDFVDSAGAELLIEHVARLLRRHRVLFVTPKDEDLTALTEATPDAPRALSRAVTAQALMRSRAVVMARLTRMGVRVIEAPARAIGPDLVSAWVDLKRGERA